MRNINKSSQSLQWRLQTAYFTEKNIASHQIDSDLKQKQKVLIFEKLQPANIWGGFPE